jgi:hypothetical protein
MCSTPGRLTLPEIADAGLHHAAKGGAGATRAVAESRSAGPSAPALLEVEEVAGEPARYARDAALLSSENRDCCHCYPIS